MDHIISLFDSDWIRECIESSGSQIVLTAKLNQEYIKNIKQIHMENMHTLPRLKQTSKLYEYLIPRCDTSITRFQIGSLKR